MDLVSYHARAEGLGKYDKTKQSHLTFRGRCFDLQWGKSWYTLVIRPNKVETAVSCFCKSRAVFAGFSDRGNSIYNKKKICKV